MCVVALKGMIQLVSLTANIEITSIFMAQFSIFSNIWNYLTTPSYPRTALSISETHLALVSLKRRRREFEPTHKAIVSLLDGLVRADFDTPNLSDETIFAQEAEKVFLQAGLDRVRRLAVALPEGSTRSLVITLESAPSAHNELTQVLAWKIERSIGCKMKEVRVSQRRLSSVDGHSRWFVTAVQEQVIEQYERVFKGMGWQVGLIVPTHLAEAQWLLRSQESGDQVMLSLNKRGFVAMIIRDGEPILVREVTCAKQEQEDEFYRLMVFYRDRMVPEKAAVTISRLLILGSPEEQQRLCQAMAQALDTVVAPSQFDLHLEVPAHFPSFAAAAGLSTLSWNN